MKLFSIEQEHAFSMELPKWSQMLVSGKNITVEQAKEIIFATDSGFNNIYLGMGGNNREFVNQFNRDVGFEKIKNLAKQYFEEKNYDNYDNLNRARELISTRAGFLITNCVHNNFASSCFIFGAHGWCHPNGKISYIDNIGKWPSVKEVYNDWVMIAERWKFLDLYVTLMNKGEGEEDSMPVITFHVHNGIVELFCGSRDPFTFIEKRDLAQSCYRSELGLPMNWYDEFIAKVRPIVDQTLDEFKLG